MERHRSAVGILCRDLSAGYARKNIVIVELDARLTVTLGICVADDMARKVSVGIIALDVRVYADHGAAVGILLLSVFYVFVLFLFYLDYFFFSVIFNLLCYDQISVLCHLQLFHQAVAVYPERLAQIEAELSANGIVRYAVGVDIHEPHRCALGEDIALRVIYRSALSRYGGIIELILLRLALVIIGSNYLDKKQITDADKKNYGNTYKCSFCAPVFFFFRRCFSHIFTLSPLGKKPS